MSTTTTNYSLIKPSLSDDISTQTIPNIATNRDSIDIEMKTQSDRINNIVGQTGDDTTEIVDARHNNVTNETGGSLSARLDLD